MGACLDQITAASCRGFIRATSMTTTAAGLATRHSSVGVLQPSYGRLRCPQDGRTLRRFMWGPAVSQWLALGAAPNTRSVGDGHQTPHVTNQPGRTGIPAAKSALDPRRCALAVAQFPEGRTLAADEADPAAVLLPLGQHLALSPTVCLTMLCTNMWAPSKLILRPPGNPCSRSGLDGASTSQSSSATADCSLMVAADAASCAADTRQAAQQDGEQRSAAADDEEQTAVRFPYHAAGYDPAWLVPYAVQVGVG